MVSSGLAPHKLPRALDSLLIYQQPSSTTLYYSYLGMPALIEIRLRNETREITDIAFLPPQGVSFVLRLRQSFPEDCVRLKLSSTRASQAATKEMTNGVKDKRHHGGGRIHHGLPKTSSASEGRRDESLSPSHQRVQPNSLSP